MSSARAAPLSATHHTRPTDAGSLASLSRYWYAWLMSTNTSSRCAGQLVEDTSLQLEERDLVEAQDHTIAECRAG